MISLTTSVLPPFAKVAPAPPAGPPTGDFSQALTIASDTPAPPAAPTQIPQFAPIAPIKTDLPPGLPTGAAKPGLPDVSRLADPETGTAPQTISAFLDSVATTDAAPALPTKQGQDDAGDGKTLPVDAETKDAAQDLIWLPGTIAQPIPLPVSRPFGLPKFGAPVATVGGDTPVLTPAGQPVAAPQTGDTAPDDPVRMAPIAGPDILVVDDAPTAPPRLPLISTEQPVATAPDTRASTPIRVDVPTIIANATISAAAQPRPVGVAQPAGQAFAAAIASAVQQQGARDERKAGDSIAPLTIATAALESFHNHAVSAAADAKQGALDLKQDSGLTGMIDHIEKLRDNADANDTRIRLVPDALGAVDVAVRKDGDRVHVHFAAENRASAQLLSDAQPRLAELAEARGVRLGQTSVDAGTDSGGQPMRQPAPVISSRPASASDAGDNPTTTTDSRIA